METFEPRLSSVGIPETSPSMGGMGAPPVRGDQHVQGDSQDLTRWVLPRGTKHSGLWLDEANANEQISGRAAGDPLLERVARDLHDVGFAVIPGVQNVKLIDQARADYDRFLVEFVEKAEQSKDSAGRQFRLVNFHLYSDAAMRLAKNERVMGVLDFIFGREAAVHTSLTFQYSTMQALHRDAPYFHTFPESQFVGVWTALQDIHPDSGPLSYVPASHRFEIAQHALYSHYLDRESSPEEAHRQAHSDYQRLVIQSANRIAPRSYAVLNKGDVAIWHPQLVHGGSPAVQPNLTRHSMVAHCCPKDLHVFTDKVFFRHQRETAPEPYYDYISSYGREHGNFFRPDFMNSL